MTSLEILAFPRDMIASERSFCLLCQPITCCHHDCDCLGYQEGALIYQCTRCGMIRLLSVNFTPLFAADWQTQATYQHYEIACPYCQQPAYPVGGDHKQGLFFVCIQRCHLPFISTIRRY